MQNKAEGVFYQRVFNKEIYFFFSVIKEALTNIKSTNGKL